MNYFSADTGALPFLARLDVSLLICSTLAAKIAPLVEQTKIWRLPSGNLFRIFYSQPEVNACSFFCFFYSINYIRSKTGRFKRPYEETHECFWDSDPFRQLTIVITSSSTNNKKKSSRHQSLVWSIACFGISIWRSPIDKHPSTVPSSFLAIRVINTKILLICILLFMGGQCPGMCCAFQRLSSSFLAQEPRN